jgi:hypothetical protein
VLYIDIQELFKYAYSYAFMPGVLQELDDASVFNNIAVYLDNLVCLLRPKRKCILAMNGKR